MGKIIRYSGACNFQISICEEKHMGLYVVEPYYEVE